MDTMVLIAEASNGNAARWHGDFLGAGNPCLPLIV
jgi:hypothetical protein